MYLNLLKIFLSVVVVLAGSHVTAYGQDESSVDAPAPLSPIEDTTLDSSNAAAADAANSVTPPPASNNTPPAPEATQPAVAAEPSTEVAPSSADGASPAGESASPTDVSAPEAATTQETKDKDQIESPEQNNETASDEKASPSKVEDVQSDNVAASPKQLESGVKGIYGGRVFGRYRIQIAGNQPTFNEGQKCYDKLYGKPQTYYSMTGDWFPLDWWINPGITMRMGSYSARGKAISGVVENSQITSCDQITVDNNSKTSLLFMPIQLGAKIQITPFSRKWLVVDVWGAGEYGWWQETRDSASSFVSPFGSFGSGLADSTSTSTRSYTNTGRKPAVSTGASVHILLNYLDEQTVRSMVDSMGIGYVFLSGFAEQVKSRTVGGLSFGRQVVGVGFTFETFK
jgi:hypothetical protein